MKADAMNGTGGKGSLDVVNPISDGEGSSQENQVQCQKRGMDQEKNNGEIIAKRRRMPATPQTPELCFSQSPQSPRLPLPTWCENETGSPMTPPMATGAWKWVKGVGWNLTTLDGDDMSDSESAPRTPPLLEGMWKRVPKVGWVLTALS